MERVSVIERGTKPVIFVAPHGYKHDDTNTDIVAESAARAIGAYAVINRGWQRSATVDILRDKANCNNVNHCNEDVVKEEFLLPILKFTNRIYKTYFDLTFDPNLRLKNQILKKYKGYDKERVYIFYIHGIGRYEYHPDLAFVVGNGEGKPNSYTCPTWMKEAFAYCLEEFGETYCAKAGSKYAGWARNNLNQLFRKHIPDSKTKSVQLEIAYRLRAKPYMAEKTGEEIGVCVDELIKLNTFKKPSSFKIREI